MKTLISPELCAVIAWLMFTLGIILGFVTMALCNVRRNAEHRREIQRLREIVDDLDQYYI